MAKQYVCPVCKKTFEITLNSNYAINGQLLCSKECFETYTKKSITNTPKQVVEDVKIEQKVEVQHEVDTPKPATRKRKSNKTN